MRFASFLSGGLAGMAVINPPERKLAKCTSVQCNGKKQISGLLIILKSISSLLTPVELTILGWERGAVSVFKSIPIQLHTYIERIGTLNGINSKIK